MLRDASKGLLEPAAILNPGMGWIFKTLNYEYSSKLMIFDEDFEHFLFIFTRLTVQLPPHRPSRKAGKGKYECKHLGNLVKLWP